MIGSTLESQEAQIRDTDQSEATEWCAVQTTPMFECQELSDEHTTRPLWPRADLCWVGSSPACISGVLTGIIDPKVCRQIRNELVRDTDCEYN